MTPSNTDKAAALRANIQTREEDLRRLREELATLEEPDDEGGGKTETTTGDESEEVWKWPLRSEEYERYGRQLIIPGVGVEGQLRLKKASVLLVGAGGLGCPAAAYIAGAGVGTIGLIDGDVVEGSNLHRQIAHTTQRVGMSKVESAIAYLRELNPNLNYRPHLTHLTAENGEDIISQYDIVLDCTDHPTSRYLVSDLCVLLSKPLVSAAAFKTDGQLIVLNAPALIRGDPAGGPCYRCIFPRPPPPGSVVSCGDGGVLGPVVGVMGVLQALETIRLVASGLLDHSGKTSSPDYPSNEDRKTLEPSLLIFSATTRGPSFRSVRMRGRRTTDCFACSPDSALTLQALRECGTSSSGGGGGGVVDYVRFCGVSAPVQVLEPEERISAAEYVARHPSPASDHILVDVREKEHFGIANIPGAVNVPISTIMRESARAQVAPSDGNKSGSAIASPAVPAVPAVLGTEIEIDREGKREREREMERHSPDWLPEHLPLHAPIYLVCRVGNDSQLATRRLKEMGLDCGGKRFVGDIKGGMRAWKDEVDETLPFT